MTAKPKLSPTGRTLRRMKIAPRTTATPGLTLLSMNRLDRVAFLVVLLLPTEVHPAALLAVLAWRLWARLR